ncbi:amidase [Sandaracinobacter sp. RS1-74]|uniref:amidase n=1 Tax=Sandaracinobacteroides sayramensis TaxID=2913411 RepID=UPI001EDC4195|nr:amidase [Sandaracinobacteroides sayramensis]MCG2841692.1 amidase [Sandaracinobacteroides sayramensis]
MSAITSLYRDTDAVGLARLVKRREVKAEELLEAALARVSETQPKFNYIVRLFPERAKALPPGEGPLAGVPFLVKDLAVDVAGEVTGMGSRSFHYTPSWNSVIVDRADAAGLVTFGKTTTPELGLTITTESEATGLTRNPWDPTRIAGGSSGGAAVAVAVGAVPLAQASDGGGSIRVPASCCGLVGLKTSRGLIPHGPLKETLWNGMSVTGPIARSVRDCAAFLDAMAGPSAGTRATPPLPEGGYLAALERAPVGLKVALVDRSPIGGAIHPDVAAALEAAARLLQGLGHPVEPAVPALDWAALMGANITNIAVSTASDIAEFARAWGRDPGEGLEPAVQNWRRMGLTRTALEHEQALRSLEEGCMALDRFLQSYDIILSPTLAEPPVELGLLSLSNPDHQQFVETYSRFCPFVGLANMTGTPAITLPLGQSADGLPIGIMAQGRFGADLLLLQLAAQVEQAAPWAGRRPG